jgi:CheY-like chemotaxis protein/anti-sigma regulatory factor (Ser/Thr protein kinase)
MDVSVGEFDVAALIREAAATVRPSVEKAGNTLAIDLAPDLGLAHADAFKLNQCLLNLLSNAVKFTHGGEVGVHARRERRDQSDWIVIDVVDTGIGLTDEQVSRLFGAFVQADATTARRYGGTGLGLAITRKVMTLLGGEVSVQSALGRGSTFTLSLPARAVGGAPEQNEAASPTLNTGADRLVLLIDDEDSARDLAARSLQRLGFTLRTAATGAEGLAAARTECPSLILLDINLPDINGWDVLRQLSAVVETAHIPVLIHSVDDNRGRAKNAGACDLLVKPADRDVLAAAALRYARDHSAQANSAPDAPAILDKKTA